MPNETHRRVEVITGLAGRRYWPAREKLRIIKESLVPGESVSAVARSNGVAPNLLFRWRRLMDEGGAMAVGSNEPVVGASEVCKLEDKVRALERMLGRETMETEILRETLDQARIKNRRGICRRRPRTVPPSRDHAAHDPAGQWMSRMAEVLEVSQSQIHARASGISRPRGACSKAADADLLPAIRRLVDQRPTYGYAALQLSSPASGAAPDWIRSIASGYCAFLVSTA